MIEVLKWVVIYAIGFCLYVWTARNVYHWQAGRKRKKVSDSTIWSKIVSAWSKIVRVF